MSTRKSSCCGNTLTNYFNKKIKITHDGNEASASASSSILTAITPVTTENSDNIADIGCCFEQKVSDELKYKLLSNVSNTR